jgi:predicted PurR-regulated permease PerM
LGLVIALLLAVAVAGTFYGGQVIANQMAELSDKVPQSLEKLREQVRQYPWGRRLLRVMPSSAQDVPLDSGDAASYATGAISGLAAGVAALIIVLFVGIYLASAPKKYVDGLIRLAPVDMRRRLCEVLKEVHQTLRWWLLGKIVAMVIVGVLTTAGLALLGVPLAAALGVIAAILTFVPNFGPVISAIPAVLLAFVESPMSAAYVVLLYCRRC